MAHVSDKALKDALRNLLKLNTGLGVDWFVDLLTIYPLENGNYSVMEKESYLLDDVDLETALDLLVKKRREMKIGFDFERCA